MKREDLYLRSFRGEDGFHEFIRSLGGDPVALTKTAGLAYSLPKGLINFESFAGVCTVFEEAAAQTNEPYFGLQWAFHQPADFRFSGPNVLMMTMVDSARQWVDMAIAYQKIHTNGFSYHMEEDEAANSVTGVINVHPLAPSCRQMLEQAMAAIALLTRQVLPNLEFNLVTFQHGSPEDMTLYEKAFQCPIIFNADRNTIVTDHQFIDLEKTNIFTKRLAPIVKNYMDWQITKHPKATQTMSMVVAETIPVILGVKGTDIQHASQALKIHPKKLQRLLKDEGTSYSNVLDDIRKNIAARLLAESDISIRRIALMLDYSSERPFTAATKRWFGASPTKYRQALRSRK